MNKTELGKAEAKAKLMRRRKTDCAGFTCCRGAAGGRPVGFAAPGSAERSQNGHKSPAGSVRRRPRGKGRSRLYLAEPADSGWCFAGSLLLLPIAQQAARKPPDSSEFRIDPISRLLPARRRRRRCSRAESSASPRLFLSPICPEAFHHPPR